MSVGNTAVAYQWRDGAQLSINAAETGRVFEQIAKERGTVSPDAVVDAARDTTSPLHLQFEWDDSIAAEAHRKEQARHIIRSLEVVYVRNDTEEPVRPVRALVKLMPAVKTTHTKPTEPNEYTPIRQVLSDAELHRLHIQQGIRALESWANRYRDMPEFAQVIRMIERLKSIHE